VLLFEKTWEISCQLTRAWDRSVVKSWDSQQSLGKSAFCSAKQQKIRKVARNLPCEQSLGYKEPGVRHLFARRYLQLTLFNPGHFNFEFFEGSDWLRINDREYADRKHTDRFESGHRWTSRFSRVPEVYRQFFLRFLHLLVVNSSVSCLWRKSCEARTMPTAGEARLKSNSEQKTSQDR